MFTERLAPARALALAHEQVRVCLPAVAPEAQVVPRRWFESACRFAYLFFPFDFFPPCAGMLVTQGLNPPAFPPFSRLAANLAGAEGLPFGGFEASANGVIRMSHVDAQPAKFLFHLQYFKLVSGCLLEFGDQRFQVLAQPPEDVEPAIAVAEAERHQCVSNVAFELEPPRPTPDQLLL